MVHGPLNLISILDLWRDVQAAQKKQQGSKGEVKGADEEVIVPESIVYRATSPLYAEEEYKIILEEEAGGVGGGKVNIYGPRGAVAMKADITA